MWEIDNETGEEFMMKDGKKIFKKDMSTPSSESSSGNKPNYLAAGAGLLSMGAETMQGSSTNTSNSGESLSSTVQQFDDAEDQSKKNQLKTLGSRTAQGASVGTSILPGWGTLIGAGVGAIWGGVEGGVNRGKDKKEISSEKDLAMDRAQENQKEGYNEWLKANNQSGLLYAKNGAMITPGEYSHKKNPIDLVKDGKKIGEATGGELIMNPEQTERAVNGTPEEAKKAITEAVSNNGGKKKFDDGGRLTNDEEEFDKEIERKGNNSEQIIASEIERKAKEESIKDTSTNNYVAPENEIDGMMKDSRNKAALDHSLNVVSGVNNLLTPGSRDAVHDDVRLDRVDLETGAREQQLRNDKEKALMAARYRARGLDPGKAGLIMSDLDLQSNDRINAQMEELEGREEMANNQIANRETLINQQNESRIDQINAQKNARETAQRSAMLTQNLGNVSEIERQRVQDKRDLTSAKGYYDEKDINNEFVNAFSSSSPYFSQMDTWMKANPGASIEQQKEYFKTIRQ